MSREDGIPFLTKKSAPKGDNQKLVISDPKGDNQKPVISDPKEDNPPQDPIAPSSSEVDPPVNLIAALSDEDVLIPGEDGDSGDGLHSTSHNKWHDFESQYSLAVEQSTVIEREQWGGQCEFLMSCIASAVGLGNIWRFPLIAGQNGGGAFLLPYMIVLTIIGRPLYMMELGLGQFCSNGPVKIWEMAPGFRGVGVAASIATFFVSTFYCVIMSWAILYLVYSFFPVFPWNSDDNTVWYKGGIVKIPRGSGPFFENWHLGVPPVAHNLTDFWFEEGLDGPPGWHLVLSLLLSWSLVWGMMVGGVSGSGKIAYFTALFPYVVLIILLAGGVTLDGARDGIAYFFTPSWAALLNPQTWFQAVGQCFFSLGISFGGCIMFASFNSFHHKLGRDILIISIMDTFTSVLAGTCLFSLIGNIAYTNMEQEKKDKVPVGDITDHIKKLSQNPGAGLAFVTFPNVLKAFGDYPGPNCISALFFFMIIVLAVGSANGLVGTTVTVTCDYFPKWKRWIVVTVMAIVCFLFGLIYTCPTGNYVIDIVDRHGSELVVYVVAIFEVLGIVTVYGLKNISNDFEFMLGRRVNMYWLVCWSALPILLIGIFAAYLVTYKKDTKWPNVAINCAWALTGICWLVLPGIALSVIHTRKSHSLMKRIKASFFPTRKWGPKDPAIREGWRRWKKTKPTEFGCTTSIMAGLGIRKYIPPVDPQLYWSNEMESQYQTTSNSQDDLNKVEFVEVAAEHPTAAE